jgi:uncharacterized membrane protein YphA (DoxX/SURF4 family)
MSTVLSEKTKSYVDYATMLGRWFLGLLFIQMGLSKAMHPEDFLKLVRAYDMVSNPYLLNSIAASLPWFEVFCGVLLVLGVAVRGTAIVLLGMLIPFTSVIIRRALVIAATKGLPICAIKFDCGCGNGEVYICGKVLSNLGLILLSLWLVLGFGRRLCLRYTLSSNDATSPSPEGVTKTEIA